MMTERCPIDFANYFSASRSAVKLKLDVNGFNLERCSNVYRSVSIELSNTTLCAGGEDSADSCSGDSGDSGELKFNNRLKYLFRLL